MSEDFETILKQAVENGHAIVKGEGDERTVTLTDAGRKYAWRVAEEILWAQRVEQERIQRDQREN